MKENIVIVGGGAAGMIAAIVARRNGGHVTLLEKNDRLGKKLLATGNGRCNYTNINLSSTNYHGENPKFTYSALESFNVDRTMDFFEILGITPFVEDGGKVFPMSLQSSSVLDVLRLEIEYLGIEIKLESDVKNISKKKEFILELENGEKIKASKVIIATGGMAMPASGSDGSGYALVEELGHTIVETFPGLVQLKLEGNIFKNLKGVKFPGRVKLLSKDKLIIEDFGDVLFTDYGISGPPILQISRTAIKYLKDKQEIKLSVSIIDSKSKEELYDYLDARFISMKNRTIEEALIGLINKRLIPTVLKEIGIKKDKRVTSISKKEIRDIARILTQWEFKISGSKGWKDAQVTAGGVSTGEVDNKTMESKKCPGLYLVGEILDIDGDCGGFNLQWAWSSGYIAGMNSSGK
nr:NAD(P)/FAD-dependent oxidoreductase [Tissierella sp.]